MLKTIIQFGLSALFLLLISISLFAESKDDDEKTVKVKNITWEEDEGGILTRGIGFSGGILAGNGFSYRRQPPKGHGYQFSGIYLCSKIGIISKLPRLGCILSRGRG